MKVTLDVLRDVTTKAIQANGYSGDEVKALLDVMLYAQLRGNNQGVVKLIGSGMPRDKSAKKMKIVKDGPMSAIVDGQQNHGMIALQYATKIAIKKSKSKGFAIVGTNNTSTSTGCLGYYADLIAREQLIGIVMATSPPSTAPHNSYESQYGTNPIAFGIPSSSDPIVLDLATSAMAFYGLVEAKTANKLVAPDVGYDSNGKGTTDPAQIMDGALRSFDRSHKGSGLAFVVQALAGPLVSASFAGLEDVESNWGNLVIVIDPKLVNEKNTFLQKVSDLAHRIRGSKRLNPHIPVSLPGDKGNSISKEALKSNSIEIDENLWNELVKVSTRSKL